MTDEMQELEKRDGAVEYNRNAMNGPTARSLGGFMKKKTGQRGGGDSPCYYWGYVILEKLRIFNNEKKSKPRLRAEEESVVLSMHLFLKYFIACRSGYRESLCAALAGTSKLRTWNCSFGRVLTLKQGFASTRIEVLKPAAFVAHGPLDAATSTASPVSLPSWYPCLFNRSFDRILHA